MKKKYDNKSLALSMAAIAVGMVMLAYASVPLYRLFCQVTGFGGTIQIAKNIPKKIIDREIVVSFNADTDPNLPWKFRSDQHQVKIKIGQNKIVSFYAENLSDKPVKGMATFNVVPQAAGIYFNKVQCFCFDEQVLKPKEKIHFPVSFFIDPEITNDKYLKNLKTITLSYTFFKVKDKK